METIYDVFRMLVQRSRQTMADSEVERAIAIIDQAEAARLGTAAGEPAQEATEVVTGA